MSAPKRAIPRSGIPDRSVPRVLAVFATLAVVVGLATVLIGSYTISQHQLTAQPGPGLAVPGGASWAPDSTSDTPTPSASTSVSAASSAAPSTTAAAPRTSAKVTAKAATTARQTTAAATSASSSTTPAADVSAMEQAVLALTNTQRAANGCPALVWNATLAGVARAHSQDMATKNYFDHNSPDGTTPAQRVQAAGYAYTLTAENIAAGQATPADVMTSWMNSAGHKANIINCALKELGVGFATGGSYGTYWTQDFGTR